MLRAVQKLLLLLVSIITLVERPGEGDQKKKEALEYFGALVDILVSENMMPAWVGTLMKSLAPWLIDTIVSYLNSKGWV